MQQIIRKYTRRVYDSYSTAGYDVSMDNLNPINPTVLEKQFDEMLQVVKTKIVNNYEKAKIQPPDDLFESPGVDPKSLLNAIDNLISSIKKDENPLMDLVDLGISDLTPFLTAPEAASSLMDNPLTLDCNGIEKTLLSSSEISNDNSSDDDSGDSDEDGEENKKNNSDLLDEENSDSSGGSKNGGNEEDNTDKYTITYEISNGSNNAGNPSTYNPNDCPVQLYPAVADDGYVFKSWYYDASFSEKVPSTGIPNKESDVTVYARIVAEEDDDPDEDEQEDSPDPNLPNPFDDNENCDMVELTWLRIIMIILIIVQILIKVLVIAISIMRMASAIAKDAQLCWINPPSLTSLISVVIQTLAAIIFQLIGMILMKLWALLNLDCVVDSVTDMIDQVNAILNGMSDAMRKVDALALDLGKPGTGIATAIKALKDSLVQQFEDIKNQWSIENLGEQLKEALGGVVSDYKALFTNPALLYEKTVPPEIRNKIQSLMDAYNASQTAIMNMGKTYNKMMGSIHKLQNGDAKNIVTSVFG